MAIMGHEIRQSNQPIIIWAKELLNSIPLSDIIFVKSSKHKEWTITKETKFNIIKKIIIEKNNIKIKLSYHFHGNQLYLYGKLEKDKILIVFDNYGITDLKIFATNDQTFNYDTIPCSLNSCWNWSEEEWLLWDMQNS